MLGQTEILVILGLAVFLFGAPKVIGWAKTIGQAKKAYEKELTEEIKQ